MIWFDAHADLNTPHQSPSGHFHGMPLRMLLGDGEPSLLEHSFSNLQPNQVFLVGVRDLDQPESDYIQQTGIKRLAPNITDNELISAISAGGFDNVYIHFDLDVLEPNEYKNMLLQVEAGAQKFTALKLVEALTSQFNIVGSSLLEYAGDATTEHEPFLMALKHWLRDVHFDEPANSETTT